MAPVPIKFIVSFSSEDSKHPVENLLTNDGCFRKWLCASEDKTGQTEVLLQLERACKFSYIDIGNFGSAFIRVMVGRSSWSDAMSYQDLVPATSLMTTTDARALKNRNNIKMFNEENGFNTEVSKEQWDRVRLVCTQPFRKDVQFGLQFVRFMSKENVCSQSPNVGTPSRTARDSILTPAAQKKFASPAWRMAKLNLESRNGEDKGTEIQTRLLKMASTAENGSDDVRTISRTAKLVMAATEKSPKYVVRDPLLPSCRTNAVHEIQTTSAGSTEQPISKRRKLNTSFEDEVEIYLSSLNLDDLDLEVVRISDLRHKLEKQKCKKLSRDQKDIFMKRVTTIIEEYVERKLNAETKTTKETSKNNQTHVPNANKRNYRSKPKSNENVVEPPTKMQCKSSGIQSPRNTSNAIASTSSGRSTGMWDDTPYNPKRTQVNNPPLEFGWMSKLTEPNKTRTATVASVTQEDKQPDDAMVQCPMCSQLFPRNTIEAHASDCVVVVSDEDDDDVVHVPQDTAASHRAESNDLVECPLCQTKFPSNVIETHANLCADSMVF